MRVGLRERRPASCVTVIEGMANCTLSYHDITYDAYLTEVYALIIQYVAFCFLGHIVSMGFSWVFVAYYRQPEPLKPQEKSAQQFGSKLIGKTWQKRLEWDYNVTGGFYSLALVYFYFRGAWPLIADALGNWGRGSLWLSNDAASLAARWTHRDYDTINGMALHLATQIYELVIYVLIDRETVFYFHHALTLAYIIPPLFGGRMHQWFCILGIVEATNIPLVLFSLMSKIPELKQSVFFAVNGCMLWLSFTLFRLPQLWTTFAYPYEVHGRTDYPRAH